MTELSTTLLVSRALVNKVETQATVNSAVELAFDRLQHTPLGAGCPGLSTVTLNGHTAVASYLSCAPAVDSRSPQFTRIASATPFTVDGTHVVLPSFGRDEYLVGDVNSTLFAFNFGQSNPSWTYGVEGNLTGPPTAVAGNSSDGPTIFDLVPVSDPDDNNTYPNCGQRGFCVAVLAEDPTSPPPQLACFMAANARVPDRPSAGAKNPGVVFFGDASGYVFAYDPNGCQLLAADSGQSGQGENGQGGNGQGGLPVVAGPVVLPGNGQGADEIYFVTSDGRSSQLVQYDYRRGALTAFATLDLPAANAIGMALERGSYPARLAITFAGGQVAVAQLRSNSGPTLLATSSVPAGISRAPYWCHCPGGDLIGVAGQNGGLYVLDTGLNLRSSYPGGGPAITTSPAADSAGDWFFGADDGYLYMAQAGGQGRMAQAGRFGFLGARVGSSASVGSCGSGICIYLAVRNGGAFLVDLDARAALITACVSTSPPACSGANPRLWARVEVGDTGSSQTVHVTGWSYYSP